MLALHTMMFVVTYLVLAADLPPRVGEAALGQAAQACLVWLQLLSITTSVSVLAAFARTLAHGGAGSFVRDACRVMPRLLVPCAFVASLLLGRGVEPASIEVIERVSMLATWMACAWMLGRMLGTVRCVAVVFFAWAVLYGVMAASAPWLDAVFGGLGGMVGVLPREHTPAWNVAAGLVAFFARWGSIVLLLSFAARFVGKASARERTSHSPRSTRQSP